MKTQFTALEIASFFIKKGVSPLKLQKLLYYSQAWYFVKTGNKLFEEKIQAWIYGPVVYSVWDNFRYMKRSMTIPTSRATDVDTTFAEEHLNQVWDAYGHLSGPELVDLTHEEEAWIQSRKGLLNEQPSDKEVVIDESSTRFNKLIGNRIPIAQSLPTRRGYYSND
jgi:uncharacterized phage-associated protein